MKINISQGTFCELFVWNISLILHASKVEFAAQIYFTRSPIDDETEA